MTTLQKSSKILLNNKGVFMKKIIVGTLVTISSLWGADCSGYGGVDIKTTTINSKSAMLIGGGGGRVFDNGIILGGAGYGLMTNNIKANGTYNTKKIKQGYGGMLIGYEFLPKGFINFNTTLLLGGGGISAGTDDSDTQNGSFVSELSATLHLNLTPYAGLQAGVSYRYFATVNSGSLSATDINGLSVNAGLLFHPF